MLLDPQKAPASLEADSSLLYFCSRGCRDQYQRERTDADAVRLARRYPHGVYSG
jgi:hypothetical protein